MHGNIDYTFRYVCNETYMRLYYVCMHVSVWICMHMYQVYSYVTVHIFDVPEQTWLPLANMANMAIMLHGHIDPPFPDMCAKTQPMQYLLHMLLPCMCQQQICPSNATYEN